MANPSKRKGTGFERDLVNEARAAGLPAERAYASNGRSLGLSDDVDCLIGGQRVQAKRRARVAGYLRVPASCSATVFRQDRGETLVLMRWDDWLEMLGLQQCNPPKPVRDTAPRG